MPKLTEIEGVGPSYAKKLQKAGVKSTGSLLKMGATKSGRKQISTQSGINEKVVLKFVNMVDLFRIKGVGQEYAELLEVAGVDTVVELSKRKAENLFEKLSQTNTKKKLCRRPPAEASVTDWVKQAKKLPRVVKY